MSSLIVEVCKVDSIQKHPNADKLSIVGVKGWNCIVGLDQYSAGDLVVFIPPDCILPDSLIEKYKLDYLKKNGRTGTIKLRGYISQGLILDLPQGRWKAGDDVSSVLGITKWQPPEPKFSPTTPKTSKKRINPLFDKYTDIENVKHYPDVFQEMDLVCILEKLHGCNSRYSVLPIAVNERSSWIERLSFLFKKYILRQKYEFCYGSHNVQITAHSNRNSFYGEDVWGRIAEKYKLKDLIPENTIVYGEIIGDGIQDLTYGLKNGEREFYVFDVKIFNSNGVGEYLDWNDVVDFCIVYGLKYVPQLYLGYYHDDLLDKYTTGKSILYGDQIREGVVLKSLHEINDPRLGRKILKSISPDYLTRKDGTEYK